MLDPTKALMCVKHDYAPDDATKMDGQVQSQYSRKNWSSFMIFNNAHPKNTKLCPQYINSLPGRDLHAFCWLDDDDIGALPEKWNWLEGHSDGNIKPSAVHFTRGTPDMPGYEEIPYAQEWWHALENVNMVR